MASTAWNIGAGAPGLAAALWWFEQRLLLLIVTTVQQNGQKQAVIDSALGSPGDDAFQHVSQIGL